MSKTEWYRRSTWTEQDREEFTARLNRSRGAFYKAQYLRIQAAHLAEAGLHAAAIELLDLLLLKFPEKNDLPFAHRQKAIALGRLRQTESAIEEFRAALAAQREYDEFRATLVHP